MPRPPGVLSPSSTLEVKVCDICGDAGFDEMLVICSQCTNGAEHVYCMQTSVDAMPSNWVCERCKLKECEDKWEKGLTCVDQKGNILKRACLNRIESTALPVKMGSMHSSAVLSPSKKRPAEDTAGCGISKKHASERAGILVQNCSLSAKSHTAALDLCKVNAGFQSKALQKGNSSPLSAVAGGQSSNDAQSGRTLHPSGSTSSRLTGGPPVQELKTSLKTMKGELLIHAGGSTVKKIRSPMHSLEKSRSSKVDHELFSFLLPSKLKSMMRSSSAKLPSFEAGFRTIKPGQPTNMEKDTEKLNGQQFSSGKIDRTEVAKLNALEKSKTTKSKLAGSKTVSVANIGVFRRSQGKREDVNQKTGLGNLKRDIIKANAQPSKCLEVNKPLPLETLRCDRHSEIRHAVRACTAVKLNEIPEVTISGRKREAKTNDESFCLRKARPPDCGPLAQDQTNKPVHGSQGALFESTDNLQPNIEGKFLKHRSNVEGPGNGSASMDSSQILKPVSKPSFHSENIKKQRFVAECRESRDAKSKSTRSPTPSTPSVTFSNSLHEGKEQFGRAHSCPQVQGGPSLACSQSPPGSISALQIPLGIDVPFQPLCKTDLGSASQVPQNEYISPKLCAIPESQILWRGCFKESSSNGIATYYNGIQAHPSNRANPKVWEAASALPYQLELEVLPRGVQNGSWPQSFQECSPTSNSIGIFFFPVDMMSHDTCYKPLLDRMISCDLALKVSLEFAQLLIFPSHLLPEPEQRWDDMQYLWGVFRASKGKALQTTAVESPPAGITKLALSHDGHDLGSPNVVGDSDIDMKDGTDVIGVHKSVDRVLRKLEMRGKHIKGQSFSLPPGSRTQQPSKQQAVSQSHQVDSCSLSEHFSAWQLQVEHDKCVENSLPHSRCSLKGETLSQDLSSPFAKLNQDLVSVGCKILGDVSEREMTFNTKASSTEAIQVVGNALIKGISKEPSPGPNIMPIKFTNLPWSSHSDLQESEEIISATSTKGVFCHQQESGDPVIGRELKNVHAVCQGSEQRADWGCKKEIKTKHYIRAEKEGNDIVELKRGKWNFNSDASDKKKIELDVNDDFKRNQEHFSTKIWTCGGKHLCSSTMSNSGSSSCSLSGLTSCSPRRLELIENSMLGRRAHEVRKCYGRGSSLCSSGSVVTENSQALSRMNRRSADGAGNVQQTSERSPKTETPMLVDSGSSGPKDEHITKSQQCYPEWIDTASGHFEPSLCEESVPFLPLFPMEESSTEFNTTEIIGDIVIDQEGSGYDQKSVITQSTPFIEQLEGPLYRSVNSLRVDTKLESSRKPLPVQVGDGLPDSDLKLALSIPRYRKEGSTWIRIEEDPFSCFDDRVDLSLSLQ